MWAGSLTKIMETRKQHSPEQVVRKLVAADQLLDEGKDSAAVCGELGVAEATYHRWRKRLYTPYLRPRKRLIGVSRAQSNARRHISVRSAREMFCD
jgi:putative transposase